MREHEATLPREPVATRAPKPGLPLSGKPAAPKIANPDKPGPAVVNNTGKPAGDGKPAARAEPAEPAEPAELQLLRGAVARNPEAMVRTGYDANGNATSARADQVLAEIEAEHAVGVREASSYTAAIGCLLRL